MAEVVERLARQYGLGDRVAARREALDRFYRARWPAEMRSVEAALSFAFTTAGGLVSGRMEGAPPIGGATAAAAANLREALLELLDERRLSDSA